MNNVLCLLGGKQAVVGVEEPILKNNVRLISYLLTHMAK